MKFRELFSILLALGAVIGAFALPFWYQRTRMAPVGTEHVITLTGVATDGIWTEDKVTGENYWHTHFRPAELHLGSGEQVRLILRSADVVHRFYMPELGIGPIELVPGHTETVNFKTDKEGIYPYYCTAVCGDCHFHMLNMRGLVSIGKDGKVERGASPIINDPICMAGISSVLPSFTDITQKGHFYFQTRGCVTCHGMDGEGGVPNFNYARGTVPPLNTLAAKMFLQSRDEVEAFTKALDQKEEPSKDKPSPGISNWPLVFAQYKAVLNTIISGSQPGKADANGPEPPLFMPRWGENLNPGEINAIIAFLLSQQKFEEHKGWGE